MTEQLPTDWFDTMESIKGKATSIVEVGLEFAYDHGYKDGQSSVVGRPIPPSCRKLFAWLTHGGGKRYIPDRFYDALPELDEWLEGREEDGPE